MEATTVDYDAGENVRGYGPGSFLTFTYRDGSAPGLASWRAFNLDDEGERQELAEYLADVVWCPFPGCDRPAAGCVHAPILAAGTCEERTSTAWPRWVAVYGNGKRVGFGAPTVRMASVRADTWEADCGAPVVAIFTAAEWDAGECRILAGFVESVEYATVGPAVTA